MFNGLFHFWVFPVTKKYLKPSWKKSHLKVSTQQFQIRKKNLYSYSPLWNRIVSNFKLHPSGTTLTISLKAILGWPTIMVYQEIRVGKDHTKDHLIQLSAWGGIIPIWNNPDQCLSNLYFNNFSRDITDS